MLACMGILLITGACALFVKYQPRILENQMLCGMMAVMGLGIKQGDTITVTVEGGDEKANASAMEKFFSENL